jgi:hypothetical protein
MASEKRNLSNGLEKQAVNEKECLKHVNSMPYIATNSII